MPAALYKARTTPSSLHSTNLASKLASFADLLTLELIQFSTGQHPPTAGSINTLSGHLQTPPGSCVLRCTNTTTKTCTVQCADVNTRAPHPLHCSQLPNQLMYFISLSATRGAPLGFNFNKLFFFGSTGLNA